MMCRNKPNLPRTAVSALFHAFLQIIWHCNRLSRGLQGTSARAMICRKITEEYRPATHGPQSPVPHFPAIHLAPESAFQGPPGHISSRDGIDLCPSSAANPSRHRSKAHSLARWFAGRTPTCHTRPSEPGWCPVPRFPAIHLTRQSPFYGPPGHIRSRDGIDLCSSRVANPSRHRHKAYPLAR